MADYLQRLINRANTSTDTHRRITPYVRQSPVERAGGLYDPFASISQVESIDTATLAPAFNEFEASAKGPRVERQVSKQDETLPVSSVDEATVPARSVPAAGQLRHRQAMDKATASPKIRKHKQASVQTKPVVQQRTEYDALSAKPAQSDPPETESPPSATDSRVSNVVSTVLLPGIQQSLSITESESGLAMNAAVDAAMIHPQMEKDEVTSNVKVASDVSLKPVRTIVHSQDKNSEELRPSEIKPSSSPLPVKEQPRLVIGRLQVDVVSPQPQATLPQQVAVSTNVERPQQPRGAKLTSKLRFGLGQM